MSGWRGHDNGCPCNGCEERQPGTGCHDRCAKFREWHDLQEKKKQVKREKDGVVAMSDAKRKAIWRSQRYGRQSWNPHRGSKK